MSSEPTSHSPATTPSGTAAPKTSRLFFAWQPDELTRSRLLDWQKRLGRSRQLSAGIRWLNPDQLHVSLLFLGEVPEEQAGTVIERAAAAADDLVARGVQPAIELDQLAFFPRRSRPRVLVLAGPASGGLKDWHRALRQAVLDLVPAIERPLPLKPHVTLGRVTSHQATGAKLARVREPVLWPATPLSLMESQLQPSGAVYLTRWSHQATA